MSQTTEAVSGLVVVDKPAGMTSHDVVARLRRRFGTRRVGHGGTLDPMATGVLVIGVNSGTKALQFVTDAAKTYAATVRLGEGRVTDDAEGEVIGGADPAQLTDAAVAAVFAALTGDIQQVPSSVSAVKVGGRKSYDRVRAGEAVELAPRPVRIDRLEVLGIRRVPGFIDVDIEVDCSKGTFIRAIARDAGAALGVGGHLTALRRTRVGGFRIEDAASWESAEMLPMRSALSAVMPEVRLTPEEAAAVPYGKRLAWRWSTAIEDPIAVLSPDDRVLAIGYRVGDELAYHSVLTGSLAG